MDSARRGRRSPSTWTCWRRRAWCGPDARAATSSTTWTPRPSGPSPNGGGWSPDRHTPEEHVMRINLASVLVDDQEKALRFYTEVLGFVKKTEVPMGEHRWLTVVSPEDPDGVELVLEPDEHPAVKPFKAALV